jgi:vancomycin permeability regulator SanA
MAWRVRPLVRRAAGATFVAVLILVGVANAGVALGGRGHEPSWTDKPVAIVPGAAALKGRPGMALTARLAAALALYREGQVSAVLVSGIDSPQDPEVEAMETWLSSRGVLRTDILIDRGGSRTWETMRRAADLFQIRRAIVCTQVLSMPRSLFLARRAGMEAEGIAVPTPMTGSARWIGTEILKNTLAFVDAQLPRAGGAPKPVEVALR